VAALIIFSDKTGAGLIAEQYAAAESIQDASGGRGEEDRTVWVRQHKKTSTNKGRRSA
jgi:hypothetical protein